MRSRIVAKIIAGKNIYHEQVEPKEGETYFELLSILGINSEIAVVLKDGNPVPLDDGVSTGEITIIQVA